MHGGAHGSGAPSGERNGMYRHGRYTREAIELRRVIRELCGKSRMLAAIRCAASHHASADQGSGGGLNTLP
jgi:hypothetical protein